MRVFFQKLGTVERQGEPRDAEAERLIAGQIAQHPAAPYYMAQTIVVQEQALIAAQARIEELERQSAQRSSSGGGLFGGLFGGGASQQPKRPTRPQGTYQQHQPYGQANGPWGGQQSRGGGGFLAGAAQTAVGVAGGMMLGSMLGSMFSDPAQAAEQAVDDAGQEAEQWADDAGADVGGEGDLFFGDEEL